MTQSGIAATKEAGATSISMMAADALTIHRQGFWCGGGARSSRRPAIMVRTVMPFLPGDPVHVASLGKGIVREARNGDRYLVDINGRSLVANGSQLTRQEGAAKRARARAAPARRAPQEYPVAGAEPASLDLHGHTVAEALEAVSEFLSRQMLAGTHEVHIVHGRSGGRIRSALHAQLKGLPSIRSFRLDPRNAGVTIVEL